MTSRPRLAAALLSALVLAAAAFGTWTAASPWSFPRFLLTLWVLVYLPGRALLDRARLRLAAPEGLALSLVLGVIVSGLAYALAGLLHLRALFWLMPVVAVAAYLPPRLGRWRELRPEPCPPGLVGLVGLAVLGASLLTAVPFLYRNLDRLPSGEMTYYPLPDVILHTSLGHGLTHAIPPVVPFLPGEVRHYHYGMDLFLATFEDAGVDPLDVATRFLPAFFMVLLVLSAFCFHREWLGAEGPALVATALVIVGEDLSWVPGLLAGSPVWCVDFFGVPQVSSIYALNTMLPALPILFAALFALGRFFREGGRAWLVLAAGLSAALFEYKVFASAQLCLALGVTALVSLAGRRDFRPLAVAALAALLLIPLAGPIGLQKSHQAEVGWTTTPYVVAAFIRMGLGDTWLGQQAVAFWSQPATGGSTAAFFLLCVPVYLLGSLGSRLLGGRLLGRALTPGAPPLRLLLAVFVIVGPLLTLTLSVTFATYPRAENYDNAVWFFVQTKAVAWVFAVEQAMALGGRLRPLALTLVLALSLPSTVQFLTVMARSPLNLLGKEELGLLDQFQRAPHGWIVLARPQIAGAVLTTSHCLAPVFNVFAEAVMPRPELLERRRRLEEFWEAWRRGELHDSVLREYGVTHVVADKMRDGLGPAAPTLEKRYENPRYAVYVVRAD